jgi:hypothetical protein
MPDPVFDPAERVPPQQGGLPAELANKTPAQIAQYYQERERTIMANAQTAIANAAAGTPAQPRNPQDNHPPAATAEDFERDPLGTTREMISRESVSRQEWNQMTGAVRQNLIDTAKDRAKQGKKYWTRLDAIITGMTQNVGLEALDTAFWETAYNAALGANLGTIQAEEEAAAQAARASAEAPSGGSTPPMPPRVLTNDEMRVVTGMGITAEAYRKSEENIRTNKFPLTLDNRRPNETRS